MLFLRKIIILLQKMHQKLLTQLKNRARQNRARQKFCRENRAIFVVHEIVHDFCRDFEP